RKGTLEDLRGLIFSNCHSFHETYSLLLRISFCFSIYLKCPNREQCKGQGTVCDSFTSILSLIKRPNVQSLKGQHNVIQIFDEIRNDFSTKIDVVLKVIHDVKRDVQDFSAHMDEAELRISNVEDTVNSEKDKSDALVKQVTLLSNKLDELENRSCRSNLRLVNVLEKMEGNDAVAFLKKWLPEVLGPETIPTPLYIERAHRLPSRTHSNRPSTPRVLIANFCFLPDISAELHRRRRCFDRVKQQLRSINIHYRIIYPATLRVSSDGQMREFETSAEAEKFVQGLKSVAVSQGELIFQREINGNRPEKYAASPTMHSTPEG
uniref:L1 transposable element RRM domain-containing protein n=1 Tax=Paramormyrops kingsleyae TaxID=1676925 RepID=A0A3B3S9S0_9TELE